MTAYQPELFDSPDEIMRKAKVHQEQMSFLPVSKLQEKLAVETPELTEVEFQVIEMMLSGLSINEISMTVFRSIAGIKWRFSGVYEKFGVTNRLQLIKKSAKEGLQFFIRHKDPKTKETYLVKHTFSNKVMLRAHEGSNE